MTRFRFLQNVYVLGAALIPGAPAAILSQQSPDSARRLTAVRVTVSRDVARPTLELPYGVSRLNLDADRRDTRRASLTEALLFVPGVSISNRFNPTQDPRMSVRGFGARSAFGIRGVRVLRDGIPLTAADGQTAVDVLDLESLGSVELFRGSAGALYGNSSGGVVDFRTPPPPDSGGRGRVSGFYAGSIARASASAAQRLGSFGLQGTVTRSAGDGPRDYSTFQSTNAIADARWERPGGTRYQLTASFYDAPEAENPGALTRDELDDHPTLADSLNITRKAGKSVRQSLIALQATRPLGRGALTASVHGGWRELANPQSFAIIDLDRATSGGSVQAQFRLGERARPVRLAIGADYLNQVDDRLNFTNCAGRTGTTTCPGVADKGALTLDQRERVSGVGAYARGELPLSPTVSITATMRSDRTRFSVLDRRATMPEELSRTLSAFSPMVGVNWRVGLLSAAYVTISTSFETPTTTELANQPDGSGGLNTELKPQRGVSYEAGYKGLTIGGLRYDLAVFHIETRDELIPFEVPGGDGRRFFRNAGRTGRTGAEAALSGTAGPLSSGATVSWLRYTYEDFVLSGTSYNGNDVPGVAPLTLSAFASAQAPWGRVTLEAHRVGRQAVDDANQAWADAYLVASGRVSFDLPTALSIEPVLGIDNLFGTTYASNVVVNATRGRYYEPGAGRTYYLMVRMGTR